MGRLDLSQYHGIDWDPDDDPDGNLSHCSQPRHLGPNPERVVDEVLSEQSYQINYVVKTAEYAIVGPDRSRASLWLLLLDISHKRGDWLRPVTGWPAETAERRAWEQQRFGELRP
jgi:hypothetical protein